MFDRILLSTVAAASLFMAPPVLAGEGPERVEARELAPCCAQALKEMKAQMQRDIERERKTAAGRLAQPTAEEIRDPTAGW